MGVDKIPSVHQGKEATALQRRGERTMRGDKQRIIGALNGSRASDGVQRAMEEDEGGSDAGLREVYERAGQQRPSPEPEPSQPGWHPVPAVRKQIEPEKETGKVNCHDT